MFQKIEQLSQYDFQLPEMEKNKDYENKVIILLEKDLVNNICSTNTFIVSDILHNSH